MGEREAKAKLTQYKTSITISEICVNLIPLV